MSAASSIVAPFSPRHTLHHRGHGGRGACVFTSMSPVSLVVERLPRSRLTMPPHGAAVVPNAVDYTMGARQTKLSALCIRRRGFSRKLRRGRKCNRVYRTVIAKILNAR